MSAAAIAAPAAKGDPNRLGQAKAVTGAGEGGPASKRIVVAFGFWVFLVSDIIMFSAFFASYAVLSGNTAGGPTPRQLFHLENTAIETGCLLLSSLMCGLATIASDVGSKRWFFAAMAATFLLGATFLGLEVNELSGMVASGAGPARSAFLSNFFTLVGCHGLHVTMGLIWLLVMVGLVAAKGFRDDIRRRMLCFTLFWHALDIIWVGVFTVVYLLGVTI